MLPTMAANQSRYLPDVPRPATSTACATTTTTSTCGNKSRPHRSFENPSSGAGFRAAIKSGKTFFFYSLSLSHTILFLIGVFFSVSDHFSKTL